MSVRQCLGAWLAALALLGAAIALVIVLAPARPSPFKDEEIAVVGSSLIAHAIPPAGGGADSLLGDGRRHRRMAKNGISELEAIQVAQQGVDAGVGTLLIEVDTFVKSLHSLADENHCANEPYGLRSLAGGARKRFAETARAAIGAQKDEGWIGEPAILNQPQTIDATQVANTYPLVLHEPKCAPKLAALIRQAKRKQVDVVLILPPRSPFGSQIMGTAEEAELQQRAARLTAEFGLPLFAPKSPWPSSDFADHAHLNAQGRAHFIAELRHWWRARP